MSYRLCLALVVSCLCGIAHAQDKPAAEKPADKASPLKTDQQKDGYAIGMDIGNNFLTSKLDLDLPSLFRGIEDAMTKKKTLLTKEEQRKQLATLRERMTKKQFTEQIKKGEDFLAKNKKRKGVTTTKSGLQYEVLKSGKGATPTLKDSVVAHYHGTLIDGKVFDSSVERKKPSDFPVSGVIPGWTEALQLMKVGDKWRLVIPADLAYGAQQRGRDIQPYSTLVFEVELLEIKKPKTP